MIVDYYFIRKQNLEVEELYKTDGIYSFIKGFNFCAVIALLIGIAPNVPGFFTTIKVFPAEMFPAWILGLYNYAWFVGFALSGFIYWLLMRKYKD
jgi:NCS1 family nucleobase:cation symporter-1